MLKAFYTSATGMRAQELLIDNTANNLANVNTTAFKKSHLEFADLMYDSPKLPGAPTSNGQTSPIGLQIGTGVRAVGTTSVFSQGTPQVSEVETHMAINGEGFFKVTMPDGTFAFTRDGSFGRNSDGLLVNGDGRPLDPNITIPPTAKDVQVSKTGEISFKIGDTTQVAGIVELYRFANQAGLQQLGGNLYRATDASRCRNLWNART